MQDASDFNDLTEQDLSDLHAHDLTDLAVLHDFTDFLTESQLSELSEDPEEQESSDSLSSEEKQSECDSHESDDLSAQDSALFSLILLSQSLKKLREPQLLSSDSELHDECSDSDSQLDPLLEWDDFELLSQTDTALQVQTI